MITPSAITEHVVQRLGRRRSSTRSAHSNLTITSQLLRRLGLDEHLRDSVRLCHVAGSKGKGSTSNLTSLLLQHAHRPGGSTALFTSPHLVDIRERIRIDGALIEPGGAFLAEFDEFVAKYDSELERVLHECAAPSASGAAAVDGTQSDPTGTPDRYNFFRAYFVFACWLVRQHGCGNFVVEVGIGGRLDPTNTIPPPRAAVVTSLGMDHVDMLGPHITNIAFEKAGIYKPGAVCFSAPQHDYRETRAVLEEAASKVGQELQYPTAADFEGPGAGECFAALGAECGAHIVENAALAVAAARVTAGRREWRGPLEQPEMDVLLSPSSRMDGRSQSVPWRNGSTLLLDGAHTVESVRRAADWAFGRVARDNRRRAVTLVYSTSRPPAPQLQEIIAAAQRTGVAVERAVFCNIAETPTARDAGQRCAAAWNELVGSTASTEVIVVNTPSEALEAAVGSDCSHVFITGSMFTVGGALAKMALAA